MESKELTQNPTQNIHFSADVRKNSDVTIGEVLETPTVPIPGLGEGRISLIRHPKQKLEKSPVWGIVAHGDVFTGDLMNLYDNGYHELLLEVSDRKMTTGRLLVTVETATGQKLTAVSNPDIRTEYVIEKWNAVDGGETKQSQRRWTLYVPGPNSLPNLGFNFLHMQQGGGDVK